MSQGKKFRAEVAAPGALQILGTFNAYAALLARRSGARAIYLSGAGVANASCGLPDLGITDVHDVITDAERITARCDLPLLVDIDTGFGNEFSIARTIQLLERANVAAVHIEDQHVNKRCGHRPQKRIVPVSEMVDRIKAAVDARRDHNFVIMARTDALANEGFNAMIDRIHSYIEAGADMIFPEAMTRLEDYHNLCTKFNIPMLANITEFGQTPLFTRDELQAVGVKMILYPQTAFRAMAYAALGVYQAILTEGTQESWILRMQTRDELYDVLDYHKFEERINQLMEEPHEQ